MNRGQGIREAGIAVFATITLLIAGCGPDGGSRPKEISAEQAPATLKGAFEGAKSEVREQAEAAGTALSGGNTPEAFFSLLNLSGRPDLTPEQREAAAAAMMAARAKLAAAAAQGDARSKDALETYSAGK